MKRSPSIVRVRTVMTITFLAAMLAVLPVGVAQEGDAPIMGFADGGTAGKNQKKPTKPYGTRTA